METSEISLEQRGRRGTGDRRALADAVIEILTDPEKAKRMGEEGHRMARERFEAVQEEGERISCGLNPN